MTDSEIMTQLRPHQPALVGRLLEILRRSRVGVDLSDTGTGKTYVSAAVASLLRIPTLVVCPKIACSTWARAAAHFGDSFSVVGYEMLRTGHTGFGHWDNPNPEPTEKLVCQNCQQVVDPAHPHPCYAHPFGIHGVEVKRKRAKYGRFHFHPGVKLVIFDEIQRCAGVNSLNAELLIAAKREQRFVSGLSATAACNPLNMRALGYALDLHNLNSDMLGDARVGQRIVRPSFVRWMQHYGVRQDPRFHGWKWLAGREAQRQAMLDIRNSIIPDRGVRVAWSDIPGFPERQITAELYDLDAPEKVDGAYHEMVEALAAVKERSARDKAADHPLTKILRARQTVELLKVPVFTELAQDYLEAGNSVVIFVNYRQTIDELFKRFPQAGIIDGQTPDRDSTIELFQSNEIKILLVNCEAGGVACSLHDLDGLHPRVGLVSPCFSANTMRQIFGRLHRDGGLSPAFYRVIFANRTVEMSIHRAVAPKLDNIDALNDADLAPDNLKIV